MQVIEAIQSLANAGEVRLDGDNIRVVIRPDQRMALEPALLILKENKREAMEILRTGDSSTVPPSHLLGSGKLGSSGIDGAMDRLNSIGARIMPGPVLAIPVASYNAETMAAIDALDMRGLDLALLPDVAKWAGVTDGDYQR